MISDRTIATLWDVCSSPPVVAAIRELIDHEIALRMELMRNALRTDDISVAQALEGGITALEEFPSILASWAARYEVNRV